MPHLIVQEPAHDERSADPSYRSQLDIWAVGIGTIICADATDAGDMPCTRPEHHEPRGPARRLTSAAAHASGRPERAVITLENISPGPAII
jgi:hypothetical protein